MSLFSSMTSTISLMEGVLAVRGPAQLQQRRARSKPRRYTSARATYEGGAFTPGRNDVPIFRLEWDDSRLAVPPSSGCQLTQWQVAEHLEAALRAVAEVFANGGDHVAEVRLTRSRWADESRQRQMRDEATAWVSARSLQTGVPDFGPATRAARPQHEASWEVAQKMLMEAITFAVNHAVLSQAQATSLAAQFQVLSRPAPAPPRSSQLP